MPAWRTIAFNLIRRKAAAPMPVIVGSPRSGTTLLRLILDAHPDLAIPPETGFLLLGSRLSGRGGAARDGFFDAVTSYPSEAPAWADFHIPAGEFRDRLTELRPFSAAEGFRLFYRMYAERFGKTRWGDKTPIYCRHLRALQKLLPEAHFIHVIRDGRDAALSLREQWFSPGPDITAQARYWRENVLTARRQGRFCRHYVEVRYEELVREPEPLVRRLCSVLRLDFHPGMLRYYERAAERLREHETRRRPDGSVLVTHERRLEQQSATTMAPDATRIGRWRHALSSEECRRFGEVAGDALRQFGYPPAAGSE